MNYTTNYHLPQWVESDRILMEDFNDAMAGIDQGLQGAQTAAETAQTTAETAQSTASAAQSTAGAAYAPNNKPYVFGTYEGTGRNLTVTLGFRPSAVLVYEHYDGETAADAGGCMLRCDNELGSRLQIQDDGFHVGTNYGTYPYINRSGYSYVYMAFR